MEELRHRLNDRSTDAEEVIEKRLHNAAEEMKHCNLYRHRVINDDLNEALKKLERIVEEEHQKRF